MSIKPASLSYQLNALKALNQFEEGRTVVWTGRPCCSVAVLFDEFIHSGYGCSYQQILNLSNRRGVCVGEREGRTKGVCALGK